MYHYYQLRGGEERWEPVPATYRDKTEKELRPVFITVLAVSKLVDDLSHEEKLKLAYAGPFYIDFDSEDAAKVIEKANAFLDKLEDQGVDLEMCKLFATGGRGFHIEIPPALFMEKIPKNGTIGLPAIYREMALSMMVDTLDLKIYSSGRGRMWRTANVKRQNGRYKVPITVSAMREMTPELCVALSSEPRAEIVPKPPEFCVKLSVEFSRCSQKVEELLKKRAKYKPDPHMREKAHCHSVQWMMAGIGIKDGAGFQNIAMQLACAAVAAAIPEPKFIEECAGLIANHLGDGSRYGSPEKRETELRRMFHYMDGNICYEFSVGALKSLMSHPAPDLDGIASTKDEIKEVIEEAALQDESLQDEYGDVAKGVTLSKFGVYMDTEFGKKRICALSFAKASVLKSAETSQIIGYDADILVNGVFAGRCTLEIDLFSGLMQFNRFASKYGHAFQGTDAQVRMVMMRFVEQSKKNNNISYVVQREGLDIVSIPNHEDARLREPFLVWADAGGVITEPRIAETGLEIKFAGFPDPRGVFRTDISDAPNLGEWIEEEGNRALLEETLRNLMTCQRPEVLGKLIGWYVACFYKQLFQKHCGKFPLLHVNGPAGLGKTELNSNIAALFYYNSEPRPLSPGSTNFALQQHLMGSSSIPLILDEYKPHKMQMLRLEALRGMFRDAYNQRDAARGGGSRESDDYRSLQFSQLAAPMVFIAEAPEDESAIMERVVMVTLARPPLRIGQTNLARFQAFKRNRHLLGILGQYLAGQILNEVTKDSFLEEFDAMYLEAQNVYMLNEEDLKGDLSSAELQEKQNTKERPVFNHTVAKFGFRQFRKLVNEAIGKALDPVMGELENGIYTRLGDLAAATTPEYVKVLKEIVSMSYSVENDRPEAVRRSHEYAYTNLAGIDVVEISVRTCYMRYRMYCRSTGIESLFNNDQAFAHALQDSPAFIKRGMGESLKVPGVFIFNSDVLGQMGVDPFKN